MRDKFKLFLTVFLLMICLGASGFAAAGAEGSLSDVKVTSEDMINSIVGAGTGEDGAYSKKIDREYYSYSIGYGKVGEELDFSPYEVSNGGLRTEKVYTGTYQASVLLTSGTARVSNYYFENGEKIPGNFNIIYLLDVKKDAKIVITHDGTQNNQNNNIDAKIFKMAGNQITLLKNTHMNIGAIGANDLGGTFEINAGEQLIYEFAVAETTKVNSQFIFYGFAYPDFQAFSAEALEIEKNSAIDVLNTEKANIVSADYKAEDYDAIIALYNEAVEKIDSATDIGQITIIRNMLKENAGDYLKTDSAVEYRASVVSSLGQYINEIDKTLYKISTFSEIENEVAILIEKTAELTRKSLIDAEYINSITRIANIEKDAPVTKLKATSGEIVNGIIGAGQGERGYTNEGHNQLFNYALGYGRVFKALSALEMNGFEINKAGLRTEKVYNNANYNCTMLLSDGRIRVTNNYLANGTNMAFNGNLIFRLTASDNLKITIFHGELLATENLSVKTYKTEDGGIYMLKSTNLTGGCAENEYGGSWTVKKGDSLYLEFAMEGSDFNTCDIKSAPSFYAEIIDGSQIESIIPSEEEFPQLNANVLDLILTANDYGGAPVRASGVIWQLMHGTVEDAKSFEIVGGNVLRTEKKNSNGYNAVYAANSTNKFVRTAPEVNEKFIIKIVARENVKINIDNTEWTKSQYPLAGHYITVIAHYEQGEEKWYYYEASKISQSWPDNVSAGVLAQEVHLLKDDVLYYTIEGVTSGVNITLLPSVVADLNGFDSTKMVDIVSFIKAQNKITEVKAQLQTEYDAIALQDYSTDDYLEICDLYEAAINDVANCKTIDEVDNFVNAFEIKITDYVKVIEGDVLRQSYVSRLNEEISKLQTDKYKEETWNKINSLKTEMERQIAKITSRSEMQECYNSFVFQLKGIPEDAKVAVLGGCNSSAGTMNIIMGCLLMLGTGLILNRRR